MWTSEGSWPDLRSLLMVEAERRVEGRISTETRYFISSHPSHAQHLLVTVRAHWEIENGLHWIQDVAFRKDESRVRTGHAPVTCASVGHQCQGRGPSNVARPAAISPTWSKSWVSHNLVIALPEQREPRVQPRLNTDRSRASGGPRPVRL